MKCDVCKSRPAEYRDVKHSMFGVKVIMTCDWCMDEKEQYEDNQREERKINESKE